MCVHDIIRLWVTLVSTCTMQWKSPAMLQVESCDFTDCFQNALRVFSFHVAFWFQSWPLGGDTCSIGRHFYYQILAAPCSADYVAVWWVAMRPQEALQVLPISGSENGG
jgi:hypothetical protein